MFLTKSLFYLDVFNEESILFSKLKNRLARKFQVG